MRKVEKPWGYEEIWAETESYAGKILTILPGQRMSLQYHEKKEETVYVLSGMLRVWESENEEVYRDIGPGGVYHVKPGVIHRFGAPDGEDVVILECSTPELSDVVRLADDYNRS